MGTGFYHQSTVAKGGFTSPEQLRALAKLFPTDAKARNQSQIIKALGKAKLTNAALLSRHDNLEALLRDEEVTNEERKIICRFFTESNNEELQRIGSAIYNDYLLEIPEETKKLLAPLNLEKFKAITPIALKDIPEIKDKDVVKRFNELIRILEEANLLEASQKTSYHQHLRPILENLFENAKNRITWPIYEENKEELKIAFKHILKALEARQNVTVMSTKMSQLCAHPYGE